MYNKAYNAQKEICARIPRKIAPFGFEHEIRRYGYDDGNIIAYYYGSGFLALIRGYTPGSYQHWRIIGDNLTPSQFHHLTADEKEWEPRGIVYFIGGGNLIKIGTTQKLEQRLALFQKMCPVPLKLLAVREGSTLREAAYHAQFAIHRQHGEWFLEAPEILAEIERLNAGTGA